MIPAIKNYISRHVLNRAVAEKGSAEAYDLWSASYDAQPGNLMLDLDEVLFTRLLSNIDLQNKDLADIGCGTGRHWNKLLEKKPLSLTGFDVSEGMLHRLKEKFPQANAYRITDDLFSSIPGAAYDIIVSTLTVAHIENIDKALRAWCRLLKPQAEIIITDFHPKMLAFGGKRTFSHNNRRMAVRNYVYPIHTVKNLLRENGFTVAAEEEFCIDETMRHYYERLNALPVFEQFKGFPVIYGIHLKRGNDIE
ncbi:MAG: class I SAM-dependent methyltransferase [Bacteroidetes bacterium]|nr:class I SAM-dependent methyltransferase [Bacteroidota bacterium]